MRKYLIALVILISVLISQSYGLEGWNMRLWGFDVLMHIVGGIGLGVFVSALLDSGGIHKSRRLFILGAVLAFGLVWELFEASYAIAKYPLWTDLYFYDTSKDLLNGLIGASLSIWAIERKKP